MVYLLPNNLINHKRWTIKPDKPKMKLDRFTVLIVIRYCVLNFYFFLQCSYKVIYA
jgi:hypothetical protein